MYVIEIDIILPPEFDVGLAGGFFFLIDRILFCYGCMYMN